MGGSQRGEVGCLPATSVRWQTSLLAPGRAGANARSQEEVCSLGGGHPQTEFRASVITRHRSEPPLFTCYQCCFQGNTKMILQKHMNTGHSPIETKVGTLKCRQCNAQFSAKWNLMNHRKNEHYNIVAPCRSYEAGQCEYSDEICWWKHEDRSNNSAREGPTQFSVTIVE